MNANLNPTEHSWTLTGAAGTPAYGAAGPCARRHSHSGQLCVWQGRAVQAEGRPHQGAP